MPGTVEPQAPSAGLHRRHALAALRISALSVAWTVVASGLAVAIGLRDHTAVLVAFGAVGVVDAVGSVALVHHFRNGLRNDELSDDLEQLAHRIVLIGLVVVGAAALLGGALRLGRTGANETSDAGIVLAAASLVALVVLSARKQQVARRISSAALRSDGHLSAVGATLAAVTLIGTVLTRALGWSWADAAATILVGGMAIAIGASTWRHEHAVSRASPASRRG